MPDSPEADVVIPVSMQNPPWLQGTYRKYGFSPETLAKRLGLEGTRVSQVQFKDGIWDVTTWEKGE